MRFLLRRLLFYGIAAVTAVTLNFVLPRLMPGDPATTMFASTRGRMRPEQLESLKQAYGLTDDSLLSQYITYLGHVLRGDFGLSLSNFPSPVIEVVRTSFGWTLLLGFTSLVLSFFIGTFLGAIGAWRRGGFTDNVLPPFMVFLSSFPQFFFALLVVYLFGTQLEWFPSAHAYSELIEPGPNIGFVLSVLRHLILPAGTIIVVSIAGWLLTMRNTMIGVLGEDYLMVAEAKGLRQSRILLRYAIRNAMLPNLTSFGMAFGFILSGQLLTEIVFSYPGLGYHLYQGVTSLDYPLVQTLFLMITFAVLITNLVVDLLYVRLDPRVQDR